MRAWTNKIDMWERKWVLQMFVKILGKFWQMMEVESHGERGIKDDSTLLSLDKCKDSAFINQN